MHSYTRIGLVLLLTWGILTYCTWFLLPRYEADPHSEWPAVGARLITYPTDPLIPVMFWSGIVLTIAGWIKERGRGG